MGNAILMATWKIARQMQMIQLQPRDRAKAHGVGERILWYTMGM